MDIEQISLIPNDVPACAVRPTRKSKAPKPAANQNSDLIQDPEEALLFTLEQLLPYAGLPVWVIPTSGGKDSRAVAQAALVLIKRGLIAPPSKIILIMADTLMEFPTFLAQAKASMQEMKRIGEAMGIEMVTAIVKPIPHHNFWFEILGRGFVPPTDNMRRCTDHLKIEPMRRMVKAMIADEIEEGFTVPNLIGVRYGESYRRDMSLTKAEASVASCTVGGECGPDYMLKHGIGASKVTPIVRWRACAVWDFLALIAPAELGVNNQPLIDHYGGVGGDMRYGCWSCPLIFNDKTAAHHAKTNKLYGELMQWVNSNLRKGGSAWKSANREWRVKGDGLLSLEYRQRLFAELEDMERRHGQELLTEWEKMSIKGCWGWAESLEDYQAGSALQSTIDIDVEKPASRPLHISAVEPLTAKMIVQANLRDDPYHNTLKRHARQILNVALNNNWHYMSSCQEYGTWKEEHLATTWRDGERIIVIRRSGIEPY